MKTIKFSGFSCEPGEGSYSLECSTERLSRMLGRGTVKVVTPNEQSTLLPPLAFLSAVDSWFKVLLPKIYPYLYHNGGNIISIQV